MFVNHANSMSKPALEAQLIKAESKGAEFLVGRDVRQPSGKAASIYTVEAKGLPLPVEAATPKPCGCQGEQTAMAIVTAHPLLIGGLAAAAFGLGFLVGRR